MTSLIRSAWDWAHYDEISVVSAALIDDINPSASRRILVDVGAHSGTSARPFLDGGWWVYAFEPDDTNRAKLERIDSDRLTVFALAVSNEVASDRSFFTSDVSTGISTLNSFHDSHRPTQVVSTTTLTAFFEEHSVERIDVLKIDVEGHELAVLEGMDWSVQPSVVVCEFDEAKSTDRPPTAREIAAELERAGLLVLISEWEPIVEYGRHHRPLRISDSTSDLDPRAWGNVIGFATPDLRDRYQRAAQRHIRRARTLHPFTLAATKARGRLARSTNQAE